MSTNKTTRSNKDGHSSGAPKGESGSPLTTKIDFYSNPQRVCLLVYDKQELWGRLSINVDYPLQDNEFAAKTYSENKSWAPALLDSHPHYFEPVGKTINHGYCYSRIYRITPQFIADQFEATYDKGSDIYYAHEQLWALYEKYVKGNQS